VVVEEEGSHFGLFNWFGALISREFFFAFGWDELEGEFVICFGLNGV
jgi:hypothetical protein